MTKRAYVPLKFWKMYLIILDNVPPSVVIQLLFKEMLESFINSFILCVAKGRKKKLEETTRNSSCKGVRS